jgi:hypothetical protein
MMGLQNLCTLFGPTLMKLSPKDNREIQVEDMSKEIRESMQQAQVLFYLLQLHAEDRLINYQEAILNNNISENTNELKENMTRLGLYSNNSKPLNESSKGLTQQTDKNNNNFVNMKVTNNPPENNPIQQSPQDPQGVKAPKTPTRQPQNTGEKYAKLNMQTAL